jgi:magnesium transporter
LIDENNDRNFDHLREIETHGDHLSKILSDSSTPRHVLGPEIYNMKHALISYLNALWSTLEVINNLRYGDAELLTDDPRLLSRIGGLASDINGQIGLAEHLSEVLASGLEVLQSIYNNQLQILNNKLAMLAAYLGVVGTAVLVPNTLATVFSNPAFNMGPKDLWWYIAVLIGSTILATYLVYWWIKKSNLLPKSPD